MKHGVAVCEFADLLALPLDAEVSIVVKVAIFGHHVLSTGLLAAFSLATDHLSSFFLPQSLSVAHSWEGREREGRRGGQTTETQVGSYFFKEAAGRIPLARWLQDSLQDAV